MNDSSRIRALSHNFEVFALDPIFGVGITRANELMVDVADTSTSTYLLSVFGLFGALYTAAWGLGVFFIKRLNGLSKVVLLVIILVILNKEPHHMMMATWIILFYLVSGKAKCIFMGKKTERCCQLTARKRYEH